MKIWTSPQTQRKKHYAIYRIGGILGILFLPLVLFTISGFLTVYMESHQKIISLSACLLITIFVIFLALRLGRRSYQDAVIFWLDSSDRLFYLDVRQTVSYHRGLLGYAEMSQEMQKNFQKLEQQISEGYAPPDEAAEILRVEKLRERSNSYVLICQAEFGDGRRSKYTCFLSKGWTNEQELLYALERKRFSPSALEPQENRNLYFLFISALALVCCLILSILSHPWIGWLPEKCYFPCLGLTMAAFYSLTYFTIKHRRGE